MKKSRLGKDCVSCQLIKCHRLSVRTSSFHALHPLHYIYVDVWDPTPIIYVEHISYWWLIYLLDIVGFFQ